jgi:hypothetical protein
MPAKLDRGFQVAGDLIEQRVHLFIKRVIGIGRRPEKKGVDLANQIDQVVAALPEEQGVGVGVNVGGDQVGQAGAPVGDAFPAIARVDDRLGFDPQQLGQLLGIIAIAGSARGGISKRDVAHLGHDRLKIDATGEQPDKDRHKE